MTKEQKKKLIELLQASIDDKEIECKKIGGNNEFGLVDIDTIYCDFQFDVYKYRVKSEPKYRQFYNIGEFKPHRNNWVKCNSGSLYPIIGIYDGGVLIPANYSNVFVDWKTLFEQFTFEDGTPCGIKDI